MRGASDAANEAGRSAAPRLGSEAPRLRTPRRPRGPTGHVGARPGSRHRPNGRYGLAVRLLLVDLRPVRCRTTMKPSRRPLHWDPTRCVSLGVFMVFSLQRPSGHRRRLRLPAISAVSAIALVGMGTVAPAAQAASVTNASFSGGVGTVTNAGVLYAKPGATVSLTVVTDSVAKCVSVTGSHVDRSTSSGSPFTFTFTAPTS